MSAFVGIDISKDSFNYVMVDDNGKRLQEGKIAMNRPGFTQFMNTCRQYHDCCFAMESTGSYHINLLSFLLAETKQVFLLNPSLVKKFLEARSLRKTKTDAIDAHTIAMFLKANRPELTKASYHQTQTLITLARLRENIAQDISKTKTQLKQKINVAFPEILTMNIFTQFALNLLKIYPSARAIKTVSLKQFLKVLKPLTINAGRNPNYQPRQIYQLAQESIGTADHNLETVIQYHIQHLIFLTNNLEQITKQFTHECDTHFDNQINILTSINGIGKITTCHFLSEIADIQRFNSVKQLIAFCGTDPSIKQSGQMRKKGKVSKRGSKSLRRTGFLMATSVIRYNHTFYLYYFKKRNEGMPYRKAVIATWNKLLRVIFAMLKTNSHFNPKLAMNTNYL